MKLNPRHLVATFFSFVILISTNSIAQDDFVFWPNANYDPAIPTVEDVLGYRTGDRITWHRDAIRYFEALEEAAPDRVSVSRYAQSWEGRDLIYAVVTSPANMARIEDVKSGMQRLADPRQTTRAEAEEADESLRTTRDEVARLEGQLSTVRAQASSLASLVGSRQALWTPNRSVADTWRAPHSGYATSQLVTCPGMSISGTIRMPRSAAYCTSPLSASALYASALASFGKPGTGSRNPWSSLR